MKLIIEVNFENGIEMEDNLNKAIDELSSILKKKGLCEMNLIGMSADNMKEIYEVDITKTETVHNEIKI